MGVHGLKHYIAWHHQKTCLRPLYLHNCRTLLDGSNLAYLLYGTAPGVCSAYGGDYDKFALHVEAFFASLQRCNIEAVVLMDGGQPQHNLKLHTCSTRLQSTINTCLSVTPSSSRGVRVFPLHARAVFVSVAKRMGFIVLQCDFEADQDLAYLARRFGAKVISNDSDFFLYDVEYVLLDYLQHDKVKRKQCKDGVERWVIPCKVFHRESFLKLTDLQSRHLGLLGALSGNDCVPLPQLKEFHGYLCGGRRRRPGHTKRQNIIQLVIGFLGDQGGASNQTIVNKVVQRVGGAEGDHLHRLLLHVANSYHPRGSVLTGYLLTRRRRRQEQEKEQQRRQLLEDNKILEQDQQQPGLEWEGTEIQQKRVASKEVREEDCGMCRCQKPWPEGTDAVLQGMDWESSVDYTTIQNGSDGVSENEEFIDERDDINDDGDGLFINDDVFTDEDEQEDSEEEKDEDNESYLLEDARQEEETVGQNVTQADELNCAESKVTRDVTEVLIDPIKNLDKMSKKQRKKELERQKHLERISKRLTKKAESLEKEKFHSDKPKIFKFDFSGMDPSRLVKMAELKEKGLLTQEIVEGNVDGSESDDVSSLEEYITFSKTIYSNMGNNLEDFVQLDGAESACPHTQNSLVTPNGHTLPDWLVHGFRHNLVTREISDMVTNGFCISPPQVEELNQESCYLCIEKLIKVILVLVRTESVECPAAKESSDNKRDSTSIDVDPEENAKRECEKSEETCQNDGSLKRTSENSKVVSNGSNTKLQKKKRRRTKDVNSLRWFIRDGKDLLVEEISISCTLEEQSEFPGLIYVEKMSVSDRKSLFLKLVFKEEDMAAAVLQLPERFQLIVIFTCYWYRNCCSSVNENHILSLLFSFFMFNIIYGKVGKTEGNPAVVHCIHCLLKDTNAYGMDQRIKSMVDNLICNSNLFNGGKKRFKNRKKGNVAGVSALTNLETSKNLPKSRTSESETKSPVTKFVAENKITAAAENNCCRLRREGTLTERLLGLTDSLSVAECTESSTKMSALHNALELDSIAYDREFVHSMSEYQATVHYLNLLNGILLLPWPGVHMEKIWSGTYCYNIYKTLCDFDKRGLHVASILLTPKSRLFEMFVLLYGFCLKALRVTIEIPDLNEWSEADIIEGLIKIPPKKASKKRLKRSLILKKTIAKVEMDVDPHCAVFPVNVNLDL